MHNKMKHKNCVCRSLTEKVLNEVQYMVVYPLTNSSQIKWITKLQNRRPDFTGQSSSQLITMVSGPGKGIFCRGIFLLYTSHVCLIYLQSQDTESIGREEE
jgi:hypothetical protein